MTSQPVGSPDWTKPLPGGSQTLLVATIPWLTTGSPYVSPYFDVTAFSGLYLVMGSTSGLADFGTVDIEFADAAGTPTISAYEAVFKGTSSVELNAPVLGARARVRVTPGSVQNRTTNLWLVGHGGGPSTSVRGAARQVAGRYGIILGAGASDTQQAGTVTEGPGHLVLVTNTGESGVIQVTTWDAGGNQQMLGQLFVAGGSADSMPLWIPPQPLQLVISNTAGVAGQYWGGLWRGRA